MTSSSPKALFIISSPFQAICAIEAVYEYKIDSPVFVVLHGQQQKANSTTTKIIEQYRFEKIYELVHQSFIKLIKQSPKDIIKLGINKEHWDIIFLGNFFSPTQRVFSTYCYNNPRETKFIYLDDGSSTIEALLWGLNMVRFQSINIFFKISIAQLFFYLNKIKAKEFFSIFLLKNKDYKISFNNLNHLKKQMKKTKKENIFILGTNLYTMNLVTEEEYHSYLSIFLKNIKDNFPCEKVIYCPHRGESNTFVSNIVSQFNIEVYKSEFTIELDFVLKNIHPVAIYSFGSTASYSLKLLYPNTYSYIIIPETSNKVINRSYKEIVNIYQKQNIISL